ncbi:MAG: YcaO-like family protein [Desertimonas sp.]
MSAIGDPAAVRPSLTSVVDASCGIVTRAWSEELPTFGPPALRMFLAQLAPTDRLGPPLGSDTTAGTAWWSDEAARWAAIGEAVEWYCASLVPEDLADVASTDLDPARRLDLADVALYSHEQLSTPGFPFEPLSADRTRRWAWGARLDASPVAVPASLVYLGYGSGPTRTASLANLPVNAGLGAHYDRDRAVAAAVAEAIERDALAEAWTFGAALEPLALPDWFEVELAADGSTRWQLFRLPTCVDAAGVMAVVHHPEQGAFGVGAAVRDHGVAAARKAVAEAMVSANGGLEIQRANSRQCARLLDDGGPLSPWRADRQYRRSYREDWRDVVDIACHAQLYVDPAMQQGALDRFAALTAGRPAVPLESVIGAPLDALAEELVRGGFDPIVVDVTTTDVAVAGWTVVRVVVPGLRATAPAAFPALGETRRSRLHPGSPHLDPVPHV